MLLALGFALQLGAALPSLTVRHGERTTVVPVTSHPDGGSALRGDLLAEALGGRLVTDGAGRFHIELAEQRIAMSAGGTLAISAGDTMPLSVAPFRTAGRFYLPMAVASDLLPRTMSGLLFDVARHELRRFAAVTARRTDAPVRGGGKTTSVASSPAPRASAVPQTDVRRSPNSRRRLVVVDAGHGGPDRGMTGPIKATKKVYEKDITLAVALALRDALEQRGIDVLMTRSTDTLIALEDRGRIASKAKGDLFISVHVNAANPGWRDPAAARGFETYFLAEAKTEDERRVEAMENEAIKFETRAESSRDDPLSFIMHDLAQNEQLRESSKLASLVQHQLQLMHPGPSRGVKQAGFMVLVTAFMPAVLVEVGFGSNVAESAYITNALHQKELADAIADAAVAFLAQYERKVGTRRAMTSPPRLRRLRTTVLVAVVALASGCAYYNGIYNAKGEAHKGDVKLRSGRDDDARADFALSAAKAETVLVRFPKSRWRTRALFFAGRGEVLNGQCENGVPRLNEFMARADADSRDRERARVAYAICDIVFHRLTQARSRLDSLIDSREKDTAMQAKLWAARAALASGDRDGAERYLVSVSTNSLQWELVSASQTAQDWVRVESLLVQRASVGDYRADVPTMLRELSLAGRFSGVEEVVRRYDLARLRDRSRVTLHYAVGDLALQAGRDTSARQHLFVARRLAAGDTVIERESDARLALLTLRRVTTTSEIDTIVARIDTLTKRSVYYRRMVDQLLLYRLLEAAADSTRASLFLAAEVARDSLRAPRLAYELFRRIGTELPSGPFAPKALAAAALLEPDSAPAFRARIMSQHPQSAVAAWLRGDDPAAQSDFAQSDFALRQMWFNMSRSYADTLRKIRDLEKKTSSPGVKKSTP